MINKKGVSLMVSYVLLVVIGVSLAVLVYAFLKARLPSDKAECSEDLSLYIEEGYCDLPNSLIVVKLTNRGLFNVTAAFIRFGESNTTVHTQINIGTEYLHAEDSANALGLPPGASTATRTFAIQNLDSSKEYILEVQPAIFANRVLVPCPNKIITQPITCS
jgi:hypothetical protein